MTRVTIGPCSIRIEGHANAVDSGVDPVCAGVSALGFTLLAAADERPEFHPHVYANQDKAVLDVQCYPDEDAKEQCEYLFSIIHAGLRLIESENKDFLRIGGSVRG